jgi:hypothetical protein
MILLGYRHQPGVAGEEGNGIMLWKSLQAGWANTSAIFALALLPIVLIGSAAPKPAGQHQVKIERPYLVAADQRTLDLIPVSN